MLSTLSDKVNDANTADKDLSAEFVTWNRWNITILKYVMEMFSYSEEPKKLSISCNHISLCWDGDEIKNPSISHNLNEEI